jgi:hypothetical protein
VVHLVGQKAEEELTYADMAQLAAYAAWAAMEGTYYGNREQFDKRHEKLTRWLDREMEKRR